jgi:hypothetical protein
MKNCCEKCGDVHHLVRQCLDKDCPCHSEIREDWTELSVNNWISTDKDGKEYLDETDIHNLKIELKGRIVAERASLVKQVENVAFASGDVGEPVVKLEDLRKLLKD